MRFFLKLLSVTAFVTSGLVMALGLAVGTASAEEAGHLPVAPWNPLDNGTTPAVDSSIVDSTTVELVVTEEGAAGPANQGTSVETTDLGLEVPDGAEITFRHETLDGAGCGTNNVRVFVVIDGVNTNSWDQLQPSGDQCGTEDGLVTFTVTNGGTISHAGLVMDNTPPAPGTVRIWDLTVNGTLVLFQEPAQETETETETETPSSSPSTTTEKGLPPTGEGADENNDAAAIVAAGAGTLLGGLLLYWLIKARRERLAEIED